MQNALHLSPFPFRRYFILPARLTGFGSILIPKNRTKQQGEVNSLKLKTFNLKGIAGHQEIRISKINLLLFMNALTPFFKGMHCFFNDFIKHRLDEVERSFYHEFIDQTDPLKSDIGHD